MEGCLPSNTVFYQMSSSIDVQSPSMLILHRRLSSIKLSLCLPNSGPVVSFLLINFRMIMVCCCYIAKVNLLLVSEFENTLVVLVPCAHFLDSSNHVFNLALQFSSNLIKCSFKPISLSVL